MSGNSAAATHVHSAARPDSLPPRCRNPQYPINAPVNPCAMLSTSARVAAKRRPVKQALTNATGPVYPNSLP